MISGICWCDYTICPPPSELCLVIPYRLQISDGIDFRAVVHENMFDQKLGQELIFANFSLFKCNKHLIV